MVMSAETWALIHTERQNLISDLEKLTPEQWRTPSLCDAWNVHQMLGHLVALTKQTPPKFFGKFIAAWFNFDRLVARDVAKESAGTPQETLAEFTRHVEDTTAPPGPVDSWIGEVVVHSADIRRPLGIPYAPPVTTSRQVADFYKNSGSSGMNVGDRAVWPLVSPCRATVLGWTGRAAICTRSSHPPATRRGPR